MKISSIGIKNFRGFKDEEIALDDITVFVGENNTGKSTVLEAVRYALGSLAWNEKLTKYDFHLDSGTSHAGAAGDILIQIELSEVVEDEWPDEIQQTLPDSIDIDKSGLRHFYLALKGSYNRSEDKPSSTREFQNHVGASKGAKANTAKAISDLKNLIPLFYIGSLRDSNKEFEQRRGLFSIFLNSEVIPEEERNRLEKKLADINTEIIEVLGNIKSLKEHLKKSMTVIVGTEESIVDIEPLPSNVNDLIGKAEVILQSKSGIRLPLEKHGSGAQSLAVLFLYEAFLTVLLQTEYDKFSEPILLIEEPEAHLHPSAVRLFWRFLEKMPGQKIVTTHSGDIIANVPFSKIRRIIGSTGSNRVKSMSSMTLSSEEDRYLKNFITYSRGELFFARCWLIVEGETEQAFLANVLNTDGFLDEKGIRIIQYTQMKLDVLLRIATQLSMKWLLIADNDLAGQEYIRKATLAVPVGGNTKDYVYSIPESTIEVHLMNNGFSANYTGQLTPQTQAKVSGTPGTIPYYESVYQAIKKSISKPETVLAIVAQIMLGTTPPPMVCEIRRVLERI